MSGDAPTGDAKAIIEAIERLHVVNKFEVTRGDPDHDTVVLIPAGMKPFNVKALLDQHLLAPERRKGTATLTSLDSFIDHVKRFSDKDSAVFANPHPTSPSLTAVLDYHVAGATGAPRFGEHRAKYEFPVSPEWQAWLAVHDRQMEQARFAAFIEDRISDLADPGTAMATAKEFAKSLGVDLASPAKIMDLSRGLQLNVESKVGASVNLSSGEGQITFQEQHSDQAGAPLKIPGAFLVQIPVFRGDAQYQIGVRLRYRVSGGKVSWACVLYRTDRVFDDAFQFACKKVREATGLPIFTGSPED